MTRRLLLLIALILTVTAHAFAQGVQTGTITGSVRDQKDLVMPGVVVTATSPSLLGTRTAATDTNGVYVIAGLPPGAYSVRFERMGFRTVEATQRVALGQTVQVDAAMPVAGVVEEVQVSAETPGILTSVQGGMNFRTEETGKLAAPRTLWGLSELAPGPHRQHAEHVSSHDRGRLCLRQPVSGQWRRRRGQFFRAAEQSVHRGRHRGGPGPDLGDLRRVRALRRRRRQRHHAQRRQPVQRLPAPQFLQPVLDRADAVRSDLERCPYQRYSAQLRGYGRRPRPPGSFVVLRGGTVPVGLVARAAARHRHPVFD